VSDCRQPCQSCGTDRPIIHRKRVFTGEGRLSIHWSPRSRSATRCNSTLRFELRRERSRRAATQVRPSRPHCHLVAPSTKRLRLSRSRPRPAAKTAYAPRALHALILLQSFAPLTERRLTNYRASAQFTDTKSQTLPACHSLPPPIRPRAIRAASHELALHTRRLPLCLQPRRNGSAERLPIPTRRQTNTEMPEAKHCTIRLTVLREEMPFGSVECYLSQPLLNLAVRTFEAGTSALGTKPHTHITMTSTSK
jgi:hypothetical protein